jgi:hypothetical protein
MRDAFEAVQPRVETMYRWAVTARRDAAANVVRRQNVDLRRSTAAPRRLAGGLWWITASERLIGREHRNRWWENVLMTTLFALAVSFAFRAVVGLVGRF